MTSAYETDHKPLRRGQGLADRAHEVGVEVCGGHGNSSSRTAAVLPAGRKGRDPPGVSPCRLSVGPSWPEAEI